MHAFTILCLGLLVAAPAPARAADPLDGVRAAIAASITARMGAVDAITVDVLQAPDEIPEVRAASPQHGARLGRPSRFVMTPVDGTRFTVVATVTARVGHVVARHPLERGAELTAADVEWRERPLEGVPVEPLPTLHEVLASRPRRDIAEGEVLSRTVLTRALAVRAGDVVTLTYRSGAIEARGIGRAVSSGAIGDIIRILRPGTRRPARGRIVAPAAVELVP